MERSKFFGQDEVLFCFETYFKDYPGLHEDTNYKHWLTDISKTMVCMRSIIIKILESDCVFETGSSFMELKDKREALNYAVNVIEDVYELLEEFGIPTFSSKSEYIDYSKNSEKVYRVQLLADISLAKYDYCSIDSNNELIPKKGIEKMFTLCDLTSKLLAFEVFLQDINNMV